NASIPANAALSGGARSFIVTNKTAGTWTFTASDVTHTGIGTGTSSALAVYAGPFVKLQLLAPGESATPGTATGKSGTPTAQAAGTSFNVTVNAVDANWNLVNTVSDTVAITDTDLNNTAPANTSLVSGTQAFSITLKTSGSQTV